MSIQTRSGPGHINLAGIGAAAAIALVGIAAALPFVRDEPLRTAPALASTHSNAHLSAEQRFAVEMDQHEALNEAAFGPLVVSRESLAAAAIAEHSAYFPAVRSEPRLVPDEVARALAEHWALIEPYVS